MNTNVFLMSGRGQRFKNSSYDVPKQFLKIKNSKYIIDEIIQNSPTADETIFVINDELNNYDIYKEWISSLKFKFRIHNVGTLTEGQASSLYSIKDIINKSSSLFVSPCDTVIYSKKVRNIFSTSAEHAVFTVKPNNYHIKNSSQFGWVENTSQNIKIYCKEMPSNLLISNVILGFFYYKNFSVFEKGYSQVVKQNTRVNNEYYLDTVIESLLNKKKKFEEIVVKEYLSFGTPKEYEKNKNV